MAKSKEIPIDICIFCGEKKPLSREHVFADWLSTVLPRGPNKSWQKLVNRHEATPSATREEKTLNNGYNIGSTQLRLVCIECNGGWMSHLQMAAKPILIPLIKGEAAELSVEEQEVLAKWIIMTVSMSELTNPEKKSHIITDAERHHLRAVELNKVPIDFLHWTIGIGHFLGSSPEPIALSHQANGYADDSPRAQTTFIRLGELCIFAWSSTFEDVAINQIEVEARGVGIIWPPPIILPWPPKVKVHNNGADRLVNLLRLRYVAEEIARQHNLIRNVAVKSSLWTPSPRKR